MKGSQIDNKEKDELSSTFMSEFSREIASLNTTEEIAERRHPHEAMFLVLAYLNLFELLKMSRVCRSLRDAINNDVLLWLDIIVETPLNLRINDDILLKFTSKSGGRLRTLALMNCIRISDDGLLKVTEKNPNITKLYLPACSQLTPDGIVRVVKMLTEQPNHNLKSLMLHNIPYITKEHLQILYSCLKVNSAQQKLQRPNMYLGHTHFLRIRRDDDIDRPIDTSECPKCNAVTLVFDCPRENCGTKNDRALSACRGCLGCIPRCEGCGGCVENLDETGEAICLDLMCLDCWLKALKCNYCNKPYCPRHAEPKIEGNQQGSSSGFVCDVCDEGMMVGEDC